MQRRNADRLKDSLFGFIICLATFIPYLLLVAANIIGKILHLPRKRLVDWETNVEDISIGVYVMSHNGLHLLQQFLDSVITACKPFDGKARVYVIDNGSTDGTREWLEKERPKVGVVRNKKNYQFARGYNRGLKSCREDLIVMLNNDMRVEPDFLEKLIEGFKVDPAACGVAGQVFFCDPDRRREETGLTGLFFEDDEVIGWHYPIPEDSPPTLATYWIGGGACAIPRRVFWMVGGFDGIFYPAYVDDLGLSYQIWKRGGRCVVAPASKVHHLHQATNKYIFTPKQMQVVVKKNLLLFEWLCFSQFRFLLRSYKKLPAKLLRFKQEWGAKAAYSVLGLAFKSYFVVLWRRLANARHETRTDQEVFQLIDSELLRYISLPGER